MEMKKQLSFMMILSALMACSSLSTDIYLPAMPEMQMELGGRVALTITSFLIGFSVAQLVWGPISDRIGRLKPLAIGMALFLVGSVGCALASSMEAVIFWRILQAVGACTGPMLSRAMIRDLYTSTEAAEMLSTLMVIMAVAPIVGPLVGGYALGVGSWRTIFWLMMAIAAVLLVSLRLLPETLPQEKRAKESMGDALKSYAQLLKNPAFMRNTLSVTFFYVAVYAFITASPEVYIRHFDVDPQLYGLFFGVNIAGVSLVSFFNRSFVNRFSLLTLLKTATSIAFIFSLVVLADGLSGFSGKWGIVVPMFFFFSTNGIIAACSNAAALSSVPDDLTGSAAALIGALQYGSGMISSILLAVFSDGSPDAMCAIIAVFAFLAAIMAFKAKKMQRRTISVAQE